MDQAKTHILYPAYINSNRTVAKGRRINLQYAVADPKPHEIADAITALKGFTVEMERKRYCRETDKEGINSFSIKYSNTNVAKNNLHSKRQILVACAKRINEVRAKSGPSTSNDQGSSKQQKKKGK